jgi:hypothetical protein
MSKEQEPPLPPPDRFPRLRRRIPLRPSLEEQSRIAPSETPLGGPSLSDAEDPPADQLSQHFEDIAQDLKSDISLQESIADVETQHSQTGDQD